MNIETMIDLVKIKAALPESRVRFRQHSALMMIERGISRDEVYNTILHGEIIEEYLTDKPFPSCLIFHFNNERPVHVVCSYNDIDDFLIIITVYIPDLDHFKNDFRTRRSRDE